ncbi:hypothetical protein D3C85_1250850 [compost metagenome]
MKKVSAFCHFQQLMGALEFFRPGVDQLRIDDFVGFRLDHGEFAILWQLILFAKTHHRWRDHEQVLELHALGFETAAETCCNKSAEGETEQGQWQIRVFFTQPCSGSLSIVDLAGAHVVGTFAGANAAIVEAQGDQAGVARGALQGRDDLVEHGAALHRIRMADQRDADWLLVIQVQRLKLTHRAVNHYRGFTHQQGRNSVTSNRVDSSSKLSVAVYCE